MIGRAGSGTEVTARLLIYCQLYLVIKTSYLLLEPQFAVILSEGSGQLLNHEPRPNGFQKTNQKRRRTELQLRHQRS